MKLTHYAENQTTTTTTTHFFDEWILNWLRHRQPALTLQHAVEYLLTSDYCFTPGQEQAVDLLYNKIMEVEGI